jgi:hypothetical protein
MRSSHALAPYQNIERASTTRLQQQQQQQHTLTFLYVRINSPCGTTTVSPKQNKDNRKRVSFVRSGVESAVEKRHRLDDATERDGDAIKTKVVSRLHAWVILPLSLSPFFSLYSLTTFPVPGGTGRFTFFLFFLSFFSG